MIVRLGEQDLTKKSRQEIEHRVANIIIHPLRKGDGYPHDLAILELVDRVTFTDYIQPICLPHRDTILDGGNFTVAGTSSILQLCLLDCARLG